MRLLILLAACLAGCATTPEITVMVGPRWSEGERESFALTATLIQRIGKHWLTGCAHNSVVNKGAPANDRPEITFDHCGPGGRWGGKPR